MKMGIDNRIFERIEKELTLRYSPADWSDKELCTTTKNISGGGIRTSLLKKLDLGTLLDLEIFSHNKNIKMRLKGRIAWVWPPIDGENEQFCEAGIEFVDASLLCIGRLLENRNKYNLNI